MNTYGVVKKWKKAKPMQRSVSPEHPDLRCIKTIQIFHTSRPLWQSGCVDHLCSLWYTGIINSRWRADMKWLRVVGSAVSSCVKNEQKIPVWKCCTHWSAMIKCVSSFLTAHEHMWGWFRVIKWHGVLKREKSLTAVKRRTSVKAF